jgi:hypothetical protein
LSNDNKGDFLASNRDENNYFCAYMLTLAVFETLCCEFSALRTASSYLSLTDIHSGRDIQKQSAAHSSPI